MDLVFVSFQPVFIFWLAHLIHVYLKELLIVRECLTGGVLCAVSHKSSVPCQFLETGTSGTACSSQDWGHRMRHMHESPSVHILFMTRLLSLDLISWDMDRLLTLWPLLIPCSLSNSCCTFGFLMFIIVERNPLYNSLYIYIYTHKKIIKAPLLHQRLGCPCLSSSLSLSLPLSLQVILWSVETLRAHSPAQAFKISLRGHPVSLWVVQALF